MKIEKPNSYPLKHIAVLRLSAIGDTVLCAPMVETLAQSGLFEVSWITTLECKELLGNIEGVKFIIVPKPTNIKNFFYIRKILKKHQFECLLLVQASFSAHLVSTQINANKKIGFDSARSKDLHGFFINERIKPRDEHFVDTYFHFASKIGIQKPSVVDWDGLFIGSSIETIKALKLPVNQPIMAVNPSSSKLERNWELNSYVDVINYVQEKGLYVIITGGNSPLEIQFNHSISKKCNTLPLNLTGKLNLSTIPNLLKSVDFLLAPDTGTVHIARAVRIPVIGLYAVANPSLTGPYKQLKYSVNKFDSAFEKFGTSKSKSFYTRIHNPEAMKLITVKEVIEKVDLLIQELKINNLKE